jgi:hypothetical protein
MGAMSEDASTDELIAQIRERLHAPPPPEPKVPGGFTIRIPFLGNKAWDQKVPPPCTMADVEEAEQQLGRPLPDLLRRLYTEVSNGGFGPGVLGLKGGWFDESGNTLVENYFAIQEGLEDIGEWPDGLLPLCDPQLAVTICHHPDGHIVEIDFDEVDFDEGEGWDEAFTDKYPDIETWFRAWLNERE